MSDSAGEPRRQERGLRRIESILDAAALVFAESGYEAATTNAIAARAAISPGSLYQYFSNKESIAEALSKRYLDEFESISVAALSHEVADQDQDLAAIVDGMVDPLITFILDHPAFEALFRDTGAPERNLEWADQVHVSIVENVESVLAVLAPGAEEDQRRIAADVCVRVFKGVIPLIVKSAGSERDRAVTELKRVIRGYIRLIDEDSAG